MNNASGAIADDDYDRFDESAELSSNLGWRRAHLRLVASDNDLQAFFRSEQATRVEVNAEGIAHYKKLLKAYASRRVAALTMFHDTPLALEEHASSSACYAPSAWLCPWAADAFEAYAALLLRELSAPDLGVKYWLTVNEPQTYAVNGYAVGGAYAPGRCTNRSSCYAGDDQVEPYVASKYLLLAHARAFRAWRRAGSPGEACGIVLVELASAIHRSAADAAATRALEWEALFSWTRSAADGPLRRRRSR